MKALILTLALLTGCTTVVPVTQKFPSAPAQELCSTLKKLPDNPQLSDVAKTVAINYSEYYVCAAKVDAWQEWYTKQKILYEGLGK